MRKSNWKWLSPFLLIANRQPHPFPLQLNRWQSITRTTSLPMSMSTGITYTLQPHPHLWPNVDESPKLYFSVPLPASKIFDVNETDHCTKLVSRSHYRLLRQPATKIDEWSGWRILRSPQLMLWLSNAIIRVFQLKGISSNLHCFFVRCVHGFFERSEKERENRFYK